MNLSDAGLDCIIAEEGWVDHVYLDDAKVPTIGYGHALLPGESFGTITVAEGRAILLRDCAKAIAAVNAAVKVPLTQPQFDALVSLVFNEGPGRVMNEKESTLLRLLNAGDYGTSLTPDNWKAPIHPLHCAPGASGQFAVWRVADGVPNAKLIRRRAREGALFLSGTTVTLGSPDSPDMRDPNLSEVSFGNGTERQS